MRHVGLKIYLGILLVMAAAFGWTYMIAQSKFWNHTLDQEKQRAEALAAVVNYALAGAAKGHSMDRIKSLLSDLQGLEGIERFQIIRIKDGQEETAVFSDFKSPERAMDRASTRGSRVKGEALSSRESGINHPEYQKTLQAIVRDPFREKGTYYLESMGDYLGLTYLKPLLNGQVCAQCHQTDSHLLGVLMLTKKLQDTQDVLGDYKSHFLWVSVLVVVLAGVILNVSMHRGFVSPMRQVVNRMRSVAEGEVDLSGSLVTVRCEGEIGEMAKGFNRLLQRIHEISQQMLSTARQVIQAVEEVLVDTKLIGRGSEIQTESIESAFRAVSDMNASVGGVHSRVTELALLSKESMGAIMQIASKIQEIAAEMDVLFRSIEGVSSAIMELSSSTYQINENVELLSTSAEETAVSAVQMERIIEQIRGHLHSAVEMSSLVASNARQGEESVDQSLEGIQGIREYSDEIYAVIHRLQKKMDDIGRILDVIAEVAEQTNLLALNAAIIAAQSGEQGKGFAVVAREIKDLAERTAASTQEIHQIIVGLQTEGMSAVKVIEEGSRHVEEGVLRSQGARHALGKIMESSQVSAQQISEVAGATDEQAKGVQRVAEEMQRVNEMVKQIARTTMEQKKSTKLVIENTEDTRQIAHRVKLATQEQAHGNRQVQELVQDINRRVRGIVEDEVQQKKECAEILKAIEEIRAHTTQNMDAVGRVGYAIENLMKQSKQLEKELSRFKS